MDETTKRKRQPALASPACLGLSRLRQKSSTKWGQSNKCNLGEDENAFKSPTASHDGTKHGAVRRLQLLGGVIDRKYTAVSCSCQESEGQPHFALCVHHLNARFYTSVNVKSENSVQSILPSADWNVHSIKAFERAGSIRLHTEESFKTQPSVRWDAVNSFTDSIC